MNIMNKLFDFNQSLRGKDAERYGIKQNGKKWTSNALKEVLNNGGKLRKYNFGYVLYDNNDEIVTRGNSVIEVLINLKESK